MKTFRPIYFVSLAWWKMLNMDRSIFSALGMVSFWAKGLACLRAGLSPGQGGNDATSCVLCWWQWAPSVVEKLQSGKLRPELLIVALSKVGINLIHNLSTKTVIGNIFLPGTSAVRQSAPPHTMSWLSLRSNQLKCRHPFVFSGPGMKPHQCK